MIGTLSLYIARRFLAAFAAAFVTVLLVVLLVDLVEQLRRSAGTGAGFEQVLQLAVLHAPSLMLEILPFLTLIAALACFARLARASELVVTRAAGVSVWRLLAPALIAAALLGTAAFGALNPVASGMLQRFERLEARWIRDRTSLLSVSDNGLWLRQATGAAQTVINARRANADGTRLWRVSLFRFDGEDRLQGRVEAGRAVLEPGRWALYDVREWDFAHGPAAAAAGDRETGLRPTDLERMTLPTDLTRDQILESFASPKTISFWELPGFIASLEAAGVSATRHRMHWQAQLALPVLLAAMVLIGAAFSMRHARFGGLGLMALGAIGTGLGYFFLANLTQAFGASGAIAAPLAAWIPPVAMALLAIGLLLHLEDG
jgi:lipopolysaccharide export system permease protein